jgi:hypothetical protein
MLSADPVPAVAAQEGLAQVDLALVGPEAADR